jgi:hypothetical protein
VLKTNLANRKENQFPDCRIISDYLHLLTESKMLSWAAHTGVLCYKMKLCKFQMSSLTNFVLLKHCFFFVFQYITCVKLFIVIFQVSFQKYFLI